MCLLRYDAAQIEVGTYVSDGVILQMATVWNCIAYLSYRFIWTEYRLILYI